MSPGPATPSGLPLAPGISVPEGLVRWQFSRSGGPGGQNVNKVSTKAELRISLDDLPVSGRVKRRILELGGRRVVGVETFLDDSVDPPVTRHRGGEIIIVSESERSQSGNKSECLARLRELLVEAMHVPKVRRKTKPSRSSKERRIGEKKQRGDIKKGRGRIDH